MLGNNPDFSGNAIKYLNDVAKSTMAENAARRAEEERIASERNAAAAKYASEIEMQGIKFNNEQKQAEFQLGLNKQLATYKRPTLMGIDQVSGDTKILAQGGPGGDYQSVILQKPTKASATNVKQQVADDQTIASVLNSHILTNDMSEMAKSEPLTRGTSALIKAGISNIVGKRGGQAGADITKSMTNNAADEAYQAKETALRSNLNTAIVGGGRGAGKAFAESLKMVPPNYEETKTQINNFKELRNKLDVVLSAYTPERIRRIAVSNGLKIGTNKEGKEVVYTIANIKGKQVKVPLYDLEKSKGATEADYSGAPTPEINVGGE